MPSNPHSDSSQSNTRSIFIFSSYLLLCTSLTALILRDLYLQAFRSSLRTKQSNGNSHQKRDDGKTRIEFPCRIQLFGALAALSIGITWYYMFAFFSLSYRVWATEHGVALPQGGLLPLLAETLSFSKAESNGNRLELGPWLKDVKLFRDAWEVALETSPRLFWSQPIFFVTAAWSVFLGIETHRRKILHSWAYMLLGQIVAISFAQNLFFLAVLLFPVVNPMLKPSSLDQRTATRGGTRLKPATWTPWRSLYSSCILLTFVSVCAIPYVTGTDDFMKVLLLPHVVLVVPSFLHATVPARWGITHVSLDAADAYLKGVYELTVVLAAYSQLRIGLDALVNPPENGWLHRHSACYQRPGSTALEAQTNALATIDTALYDHPAVSSVGWDSLLCTLSFLCWRATRSVSTEGLI